MIQNIIHTQTKFCLLVVLVFFTINSYGQNQINQILKKGKNCLVSEEKNCDILFKDALAKAKQSDDINLVASCYFQIAKAYFNHSRTSPKAEFYLEKGIRYCQKENLLLWEWKLVDLRSHNGRSVGKLKYNAANIDTLMILSEEINQDTVTFLTLHKLGWHQFHSGKYSSGLITAKKLIKIGKQLKDERKLGLSFGLLSAIYYGINDHSLSTKYNKLSREQFLNAKDSASAMTQSMNIGNNLIAIGKKEEALKYLNESLRYNDHHNYEETLAYVLAQLGRVQMDMNKNDLAIKTFLRAIAICEKLNLEKQQIYVSVLMSICYRNLKDKKKALEYSTLAFNFHKDKEVSEEYLSAMERHSEMLELNGQTIEAFKVVKMYQKGYEKNFNGEKMEEIARLQEELETELKNTEIALLKNQQKTTQNRNLGLIIGLFLTGFIAWLLVKRKSTKLKLQKVENEKISVELEGKNRELTSQALHLAQKNELLISLKADISTLKTGEDSQDLSLLESKIKFDEQMDKNWEQFTKFFNETKKDFFKSITNKHPDVTKSDLRMAALLSMNLDSKEIANILNISADGVKKARYRLRKKLQLLSDDNLRNYLASF